MYTHIGNLPGQILLRDITNVAGIHQVSYGFVHVVF